MGKLSRLIGMASDALEKNSGSGRNGHSSDGSRSHDGSRTTDWGGMLRGAVDAVRGQADPGQLPNPNQNGHASANPYAPPASRREYSRPASVAPSS